MIKEVYAAPVDLKFNYPFTWFDSLGDFINHLILPAIAIATILVLFYIIFGAFKLMTSEGNKEGIQGARDMITHAIIGLFALFMLFLIMKFIPQFFGLNIQIIK